MNDLSTPRPTPADVPAEIGVVGAVLRNPAILDDVRLFASPQMFTDLRAAAMFTALCALADARKPIEAVSIVGELQARGFADQQTAVEMVRDFRAAVPTTAHAQYHAALVKEKSVSRAIISLAHEIQNQAFDGEKSQTLIDNLQNGAAKIAEDGYIDGGKLAADCLAGVLDEIHGYQDDDTRGLSTGFPELDQKTRGGAKRKQLIAFCGAGKIGKTALAVNVAGHVGLTLKHPVAFISHEMTAPELTERLLISTLGISVDRLRANDLSAEEAARYEEVQAAIRESRIVFDDSSPTTIHGTRIRLRLFKRLYKIRLAIVDYFQLMTGSDPKARRYDQLVEVSRGLKQLASDLDIPIIVLAQLNAEGQDATRPPRVTDIEECKRLFKDSNWVVLLDREFERKKHDADWVRTHPDARNAGTIDVAAIRNGEAGVIAAHYHGEIQRWRTVSQEADDRIEHAYRQAEFLK